MKIGRCKVWCHKNKLEEPIKNLLALLFAPAMDTEMYSTFFDNTFAFPVTEFVVLTLTAGLVRKLKWSVALFTVRRRKCCELNRMHKWKKNWSGSESSYVLMKDSCMAHVQEPLWPTLTTVARSFDAQPRAGRLENWNWVRGNEPVSKHDNLSPYHHQKET